MILWRSKKQRAENATARLVAKPIAKPFEKQSERKRVVIDAVIPENINNN